ncbi:PAS domain-containing protein [Metabacillus rhizosphaerae]
MAQEQKEAMIIVSKEGMIESFNQAAEQLFGYHMNEVKDKRISLLFPDINSHILFQKTSLFCESVARLQDQTYYSMKISCEVVELLNHPFCVLTIKNNVHMQAMEDELDASLSELVDFKFALDESSIVAITDQKGIITYVNDTFCKVSKYNREELIGKSHKVINSGYHPKSFFSELWRTIGSGKVWKGEIKNQAKDGAYYWVDTTIVPFLTRQGKPYQYLAIRNEVTSRKRAEEELKETLSELYDLKLALDESSIVAITDQKGIITYVNDTFCKVSKYNREELIGNSHKIINSGYHPKSFFGELWRTIGAGKVWKGEIKNQAKDGTYYWVDTTIVPFLNIQGKPYQYLAIRNEVTARKRAEEELQRMMRKLIGLQEEERKNISRELHDGIGQNLYSLLIMINRLRTKTDPLLVDQMETEISNIIEEIRQISWQLRPSILDDLGLVPAIRSFINKFSEHYGLKTCFTYELQRRLHSEVETSIYRIVQEAITNARKYANTQEIFLSIIEKEDYLEVVITDHGVGFDTQTKQNGVGLFSMEERARSINAQFKINSIRNKGTTITVKVPFLKNDQGIS